MTYRPPFWAITQRHAEKERRIKGAEEGEGKNLEYDENKREHEEEERRTRSWKKRDGKNSECGENRITKNAAKGEKKWTSSWVKKKKKEITRTWRETKEKGGEEEKGAVKKSKDAEWREKEY